MIAMYLPTFRREIEPTAEAKAQRHHLTWPRSRYCIVDAIWRFGTWSDEAYHDRLVARHHQLDRQSSCWTLCKPSMAAYPQTMPQTAYSRPMPPPTAMNPPYPVYQTSVPPQPGMNIPSARAPMPARAVGRPPQAYYNSASAQPGSIPPPMKGTLRPGERIRVGSDTVIIEKYLSEGEHRSPLETATHD